jgi:hypothetical protein
MNNEMESSKWQNCFSKEYEQDPMYKKKQLSQHTSFHDLTYKFGAIKWRTPSFTIGIKILETIKKTFHLKWIWDVKRGIGITTPSNWFAT